MYKKIIFVIIAISIISILLVVFVALALYYQDYKESSYMHEINKTFKKSEYVMSYSIKRQFEDIAWIEIWDKNKTYTSIPGANMDAASKDLWYSHQIGKFGFDCGEKNFSLFEGSSALIGIEIKSWNDFFQNSNVVINYLEQAKVSGKAISFSIIGTDNRSYPIRCIVTSLPRPPAHIEDSVFDVKGKG